MAPRAAVRELAAPSHGTSALEGLYESYAPELRRRCLRLTRDAHAADDLMQERTVEVTETAEQAVVGKEARVTEQVVVGKDTRERVESIDDTVRRTKVEVEDGRTGERTRNPPPSERR